MVSSKTFLLFLIASFAVVELSTASDPDILSDFIPVGNVSNINGTFFTFTGMRALIGAPPPTTFSAIKATLDSFPALDGLSVSMAALEFAPNSTNPPHTHPRASELLFVIQGALQVGVVDTNNTLYTQSLQVGDLFVFPKGLVHFQYNADAQFPALAISAFGSAAAGTVAIPSTVFGTGIPDNILAQSFKTDIATIEKIKAGFPPKA